MQTFILEVKAVCCPLVGYGEKADTLLGCLESLLVSLFLQGIILALKVQLLRMQFLYPEQQRCSANDDGAARMSGNAIH